MLSRVLVGTAIAALAYFGLPMYEMLDKGNAFRTPANVNAASCELKFEGTVHLQACDDALYSCEDIAQIRGWRVALLACAHPGADRSWFPPAGQFNASEVRNDAVYAYDLERESVVQLALVDAQDKPFVFDMRTHGISVYGDNDDAAADTVTVATVNHRRTGSVIDLWSYKRGSSKLRHRKTISSPLIRTPNAVELVSHDSFYSTNDFHTPRAGFLRVFETLSKQAWSDVVYYDGTADRVDVAATGLTFPNGIVYLPKDKVEDFDDQTDLGEVWVASSTGAQVLVFRRKANNKLKLHQHIPLPFMPDNLDVDPTTGHVYVAGIGKLVSFLLHKSPLIPTSVKDRYLKLHSIAARILKRAASDENIYYGRPYTVETLVSDGSGRLKAVSGVSADERRGFMLLGTLYGHGVANCKLGNGGK